MKTGIELITEERERQFDVEGLTPDHDDQLPDMALAVAGAAYALDAAGKHTTEHSSWKGTYSDSANMVWPFDDDYFKPTPKDPVKQLIKAGALIAAEIDRYQRRMQQNESEKIQRTLSHDAGAFGQCTCGRYSSNPFILDHNYRCECGEKTGWSGSFKKPTKLAIWSNA